MNHTFPNILALDIGARQLGAAVFENQKLVSYAVKSIKRPNKTETLEQVEKVLENFLLDYGIEIIALEKLCYVQQQTAFVREVYEGVRKFAREQNVKILELDPLYIRQTVCKTDAATKEMTFEMIASIFPELSKFLSLKKIWHRAYYAYMFTAIAVGLVCLKEIRKELAQKLLRH
jgi:Holliday junction resolvasome RuvABC endonuclease subunit